MIKAFYIVLDTNQADVQCIREFEHAAGELTSMRAEVKKFDPEFIKKMLQDDESETSS